MVRTSGSQRQLGRFTLLLSDLHTGFPETSRLTTSKSCRSGTLEYRASLPLNLMV
jgi:hypothetical protein